MIRSIFYIAVLSLQICYAFHIPNALRLGVTSQAMTTNLSMSGKALVVQNKGGGHGELGYHIAKLLTAKGVGVTLLQDSGAKKAKEPFASYGKLEAEGVNVIWADFSVEGGPSASIPSDTVYDYVFDNYAKDRGTAIGVAEAAKKWDVKNYVYVSSAGMYKNTEQVPIVEEDAVKTTGQREVEMLADELDLPWTAFRPQYIYGPLTNKRDYLDWFFDRVFYGVQPFPLPLHGDQFVAITHAEDVASMMTSVIGNEKAVKQVFNCATNRYITYKGLAKAVCASLGRDPATIRHKFYVPSDYELKKGWFPFRDNHFFVSSDKAMRLLGWKPRHDLIQDLKWYREEYLGVQDHAGPPPDFTKDDEINIREQGYIPWMMRWDLIQSDPDLADRLNEIKSTMKPVDKLYYSALMETLQQQYAKGDRSMLDPSVLAAE